MISTLIFEHGTETCASEPKKFCRFFGIMGFGTRAVCMLFENEPLYDKDGWIQRCKQCKNSFPVSDAKMVTPYISQEQFDRVFPDKLI